MQFFVFFEGLTGAGYALLPKDGALARLGRNGSVYQAEQRQMRDPCGANESFEE